MRPAMRVPKSPLNNPARVAPPTLLEARAVSIPAIKESARATRNRKQLSRVDIPEVSSETEVVPSATCEDTV
jgi:hypothetical protein